jgi:N-acetylneuraminate synthase
MTNRCEHAMRREFSIADRSVGSGHPCFTIAEIGLAHDGSLGACFAYVDAVAKSGADAIKFQTHIAEAESTPLEPFRIQFSRADSTRYEYWKRTAFTPAQWQDLAAYTREKGLIFLSSAFSDEAVELLERVGVPAWKVGAGEIVTLPMLRRMAQTGKPVLLSSGMSPWEDLDAAVACVRSEGAPVGVFQCTSSYPCPAERLGLNMLGELAGRYQCPVGLSDHSGNIYAGLAAVALGANLLEVHVTFSRECFGPDVSSSLTTSELKQLVEGVRFIESALAHPVDKAELAKELGPMRATFYKSLFVARDLPAGHCITEEDLVLRRPGTGIRAARLQEFVGRVLTKPVSKHTLLEERHVA